MAARGEIIFHIESRSERENLSLDNFDVSDLKDFLGIVVNLIKADRDVLGGPITYHPESGSVKAVFRAPLELVAKISVVANLALIPGGLDQLSETTAKAIEEMQAFSRRKGYDITLSNSYGPDVLRVSPDTNFHRSTNLYADAELYLYGRIVMYGGERKGTITFNTGAETYHVKADPKIMEGWEDNHYKRNYAIRVAARQNVYTGEILKGSMTLIEVLDYTQKAKDDYLREKIRKATPHWAGVDADDYVKRIREGAYV